MARPGWSLEKMQRWGHPKMTRFEEASQKFGEVSQNTVFDVTLEWRAVGKEPESHIFRGGFQKTGRGCFVVVVENLSFVPCSHL